MWRRWSWRWWIFLLAVVVLVVALIGGIITLFTDSNQRGWFYLFLVAVVVTGLFNPWMWEVGRQRRSKNGPPGQS